MFDIQDTWVWCELTIDEGYSRKSGVVFYHGFTPQQEIELAYNETIKALLFLQEHDFYVTNAIEMYHGEVMTYCLSRKTI